jgi:hypothetical protein
MTWNGSVSFAVSDLLSYIIRFLHVTEQHLYSGSFSVNMRYMSWIFHSMPDVWKSIKRPTALNSQ